MGILEISLLGGFQVHIDGLSLDPIPSRTARSLLSYLAINRDRPHTRDLLAGKFWPDLPDSEARRQLSRALWQLHTCIDQGNEHESRHVITAGGAVRLNPESPTELDTERFRQLLQQARSDSVVDPLDEAQLLEAAVSLYKGDLLEGFYEDWALAARDAFRADYLQAARRLCDLAVAKGDYEAALTRARLLTRHDPWDEDGHRRVMRLAALVGRPNDAIRQYRTCCQTLKSELGTEPSKATRQLYEAVLQERELGRDGPPRSPQMPMAGTRDQIPFIGREQERSTLLRRLDGALAGSGGLVLVEGAAGAGKTRLLEEVANDAHWRGFNVLWGRAPQNNGRPYACLSEALSAGLALAGPEGLARSLGPVWLRQLARLVPDLRGDTNAASRANALLKPSEDHMRVMEAISLAFGALAGLSPLMLVLDDMQWADADTIQALDHAATRLENQRVLLVISYRPEEARERLEMWTLIRSLDQRPSCSRVVLQGCSLSQTGDLVGSCLGLPNPDVNLIRRVFESTGGLPLLVIELLLSAHEPDRAGDDATETPPPASDRTTALAPRLRDLIGGRLQDLQGDALLLLELLAVHNGELGLRELVAASDLIDSAALRAIDILIQRRLVLVHADTYRLAHGLLRRVVYDDIPPSVRTDLHSRVGAVVQAHRPEDVEVLAHHFRMAHLPERAAYYLEQSAVRAMAVSAYDSAAGYLAQAAGALEEARAGSEQRFRVASLREEVLDVLARRDEQQEALTDMEKWTSPADVIEVMRRRAWWLANQDRFVEGEIEARRALEMAAAAGDSGLVVAALSTLAMIACVAGRAADGVLLLEEATGHRGVDLRQQADARNALGQNLLDLQRFDEAEPQLLAALALYAELEHPRGQAEVLGMLGTLRMERGETALAESALRRALDLSRAIGYRQGEAVYRMNLGILHALSNRPASAFLEFREAATTYELIGNLRGRALVLSNTAWLRHAILGEDSAAEEDARSALLAYQQMEDKRGQAQCLGTLGSITCRRGACVESADAFGLALSLAREARDSWIEAQILMEWARCCLETGQFTEGLARADEALKRSGQLGMGTLAVSLHALRGRLLLELNRSDEALDATGTAVATRQPSVGTRQSVAYAHSLALAATGHQKQAEQYLGIAFQDLMTAISDLPEGEQRAALTSVPDHRAIVQAWSSRQPRHESHILARVEAPMGRPLPPEERIAVVWTVDSPDDMEIQSTIHRRRHRLLRLLAEARNQGGAPTVPELAQALHTSVATIRRDLAVLRRSELEARTRGSRFPTPLRTARPGKAIPEP